MSSLQTPKTRTPGQAFRDASRGVQHMLDRFAARMPAGSLVGRGARWLARTWTTAWWIGVTAVAAAVGWTLALLLDLASPVPAAVGAVLTVALSLNRSVRTGISLVAATAAALMVAFGLYQFWGLHVWTVAVLVAVSLIIGRIMRLGADGSLQIPATALFLYILGDNLTDELMIHRIIATLLGVAVGVVFSFIAHPERPEERLADTLSDLGRRLGDLLMDIGSRSAQGCTRRDAAEWLTASRALAIEVRKVGDEFHELALDRRFVVGSERERGAALQEQYAVLKQSCDHVNDIARSLFDATVHGDVIVPEGIGTMITSTGAALEMHAAALPHTLDRGGDPPTGVLRALDAIGEERSKSVASIKSLDDTGALLLGGSIVTEVDRMIDGLAGSAESIDR